MKTVQVVSACVLLKLNADAFLHLTITPAVQPGSRPSINASLLGSPSSGLNNDALNRVVQVVLEQLEQLQLRDVEPGRIVVPQ